MKLILRNDPHLPLVHLNLYFQVGPTLDPPGKEGLCTLTNRVLIRGTQKRTRAAMEEAVEALGCELQTFTQRNAVGVGGTVLARNLETYLGLLIEVVTQPLLAAEEVDKVRREMMAELEAMGDDDRGLSRRLRQGILYPNSRLAHGSHGTLASLKAITHADVLADYAAHYTQATLLVAAAGAVDETQLRALLTPLTAHLPVGTPTDWPTCAHPPQAGTHLVHLPERTQCQMLMTQPTIALTHPDSMALAVGVSAFGGNFSSRLMQEVRVKRSLSYGAYARYSAERGVGEVVLSAAPSVEQSGETARLLMDEYTRFVNGGLTDAEISFTQDYITQAFAFSVETLTLRAVQEVRAFMSERPEGFVDAYVAKVKALTADEIRAAVKRHLDPAKLVMVVAGDKETVVPVLVKAGFSDVHTVEAAALIQGHQPSPQEFS